MLLAFAVITGFALALGSGFALALGSGLGFAVGLALVFGSAFSAGLTLTAVSVTTLVVAFVSVFATDD